MSLRRPYCDSWEQRGYKRSARSISLEAEKPSWTPISRPSPSPETSHHFQTHALLTIAPSPGAENHFHNATSLVDNLSDSGDSDYPEQGALTPDIAPDARSFGPSNGEVAWTNPDISPSNTTFNIIDSPGGVSSSDQRLVHKIPVSLAASSPINNGQSRQPSITPSESTSHLSSNVSTTITASEADSNTSTSIDIEQVERDLLHGGNFPIHQLRTAPDLATLFSQIIPTIGDPGTGHVKFGPASPKEPIFNDPTPANHISFVDEIDDLKHSLLKEGEKPVNTNRDKGLMWKQEIETLHKWGRGTANKYIAKRGSTSVGPPIKPNTSSSSSGWKGRQYSVNPELKTRHLQIDLLQRKISHGELLSLNLSIDARRDAMTIGGTPHDVGGSLLTGTARGSSEQGLATDPSSSSSNSIRSNGSSTPKPHLNSLSPNPSSLSSPNPRLRSRNPGSGRSSSISTSSLSAARRTPLRSTSPMPNGGKHEFLQSNGYDQKERRYRAGDVGTSFEVGRYGMGGLMLWRIVRVKARVGDEASTAWYVVPQRSLGGYF